MIVPLTLAELEGAAHAGIRRIISSRAKNYDTDNHGKNSTTQYHWTRDIEAAAAEIAVAKLLNRTWNGWWDTMKGADVGHTVQVRRCEKPGLSLIIRPDDCLTDCYVLCQGNAPFVDVVGYMWGSKVQDEWVRDPNGQGHPAWFVPQKELISFESEVPTA